jgi:ATP-dependent helicase Lhr and Lhr-like helicase
VLVHQLLALTLQFGAISPERCWEQLAIVTDFSGIADSEFEILIQHMIREDFLFYAGGLLSMGDKAERVFGRKNFMEIYAVFSSPQLYKVQTRTGYTIGSLEQLFVDKLVAEISSFLLSGKAWIVTYINHQERTVLVNPAPRGKKPSWGSFAPQIISLELCQQIATIIKSEASIPYIDTKTQTILDEYRSEFKSLASSPINIQIDNGKALWWTFAGGQINHTLKYGLQFHHDWKIVSDNFKLKIEGDSVGAATLNLAIARTKDINFWENSETQNFICSQLPEYRLSKFQRALPNIYSIEIIRHYLLDIVGTIQFLERHNI